jgi:hypothetical protein
MKVRIDATFDPANLGNILLKPKISISITNKAF